MRAAGHWLDWYICDQAAIFAAVCDVSTEWANCSKHVRLGARGHCERIFSGRFQKRGRFWPRVIAGDAHRSFMCPRRVSQQLDNLGMRCRQRNAPRLLQCGNNGAGTEPGKANLGLCRLTLKVTDTKKASASLFAVPCFRREEICRKFSTS